MKSILQKDKKRRLLVYKYENQKFILNHLYSNMHLLPSIRLNAALKLFNCSSNSFKDKTVSRCIFTYRKSKIHKNFKFSRLFFLKTARLGLISGLKKSSW
nr:ribosomal protein S14 [Guinardia striata]